jgi:hypothetical protein
MAGAAVDLVSPHKSHRAGVSRARDVTSINRRSNWAQDRGYLSAPRKFTILPWCSSAIPVMLSMTMGCVIIMTRPGRVTGIGHNANASCSKYASALDEGWRAALTIPDSCLEGLEKQPLTRSETRMQEY